MRILKYLKLSVWLLALLLFSHSLIMEIRGASDDNNNEDYVMAYEDAKFNGESMKLLPNLLQGCNRLPQIWQKRISSVDVIGGCITLCKDTQCGGLCKKICSGMRGENNLTVINFDDSVLSFKRCTCAFQKLKNFSHL